MADLSSVQFNAGSAPGGGSLGATPNGPQLGVQGGGVVPAGRVGSGASWFDGVGGMTTEFGGNLPEFLEEAFAPALAVTKQKRMWEGFTAARSGMTANEISESQPWYTKLFGPTNYELGAQTFNVQKNVADLEADILHRMPELRTMNAEQMADVLNTASQSAMTGNGYTDALTQKMLMDRAGPIMDLHTKERTAWQQQELLKAQVGAADSQGDALQAASAAAAALGDAHPDAPQIAEQLSESKLLFADAMTPSERQTDESLLALNTSVALHQVRKGNFYVVNTMLDAGLMGALKQEDQDALSQRLLAERARYISQLPMDDSLIRERSEWTAEASMGITSPAQTLARAKDINRRWQARTGDRIGLIALDEAEGKTTTALSAYYHAQQAQENAMREASEKANSEAEKELLRQQRVDRDMTAIKGGSAGFNVGTGVTAKEDAEAGFLALYSTDPTQAIKAAVRNYVHPLAPFTSERLKDALKSGIPTDPNTDWSPAFHQAYMQFKLMEDEKIENSDGTEDTNAGRSAASAYFGDKNVQLFRQYETQLKASGAQPQQAYALARRALSEDPVNWGNLTKEQGAALDKTLEGSGAFVRMFTGETKLKAKGVLRSKAMAQFQSLQRQYPDLSAEAVAKMSLQAAKNLNTDVAGEYSWDRAEGQQPITAYAKDVSPDVYGIALREHIRSSLKKANVQLDDDGPMFIHRQQDRDGFPVLVIMAQDENGNRANLTYTKDEFDAVQREALAMRAIATPEQVQDAQQRAEKARKSLGLRRSGRDY